MAYDELLADRVRQILLRKKTSFEEKKMFGGLCYMVDEKMCVGLTKTDLMARIDPDFYDQALTRNGARKMMFTGREMKGFVFVDPEAVDMEEDLEFWVDLCLEFNPKAKSSKKKKK